MNRGRTIFAQLMDFLPGTEFRRCVERYRGDYKAQSFSCWDQFLCLALAQLTGRESLRDIEACLRSQQSKLYHLGFRGRISRNTLAHANETRDWRIFADFARALIAQARLLYRHEPLGVELDQTLYALDSTTIDLCLAMFPWAQFRRHKSAVKVHTLLDLRGSIPTNVYVTSGAAHDINILDQLLPEAGAFCLLDRGYLDFARLYVLKQGCAFFITRAKQNTQFWRRDWQPVHHSTGLRSDQTIQLTGPKTSRLYPDPLRRIHYFDAQKDLRLIFLTNNFLLPALTIAELYRALARGVVFSLDQTAFAYQVFLRHFGKRGQDANLGGHHRLRACRHRQKTGPTGPQSVQNPADSKHHAFRENPAFIGVSRRGRQPRRRRSSCAIETVQLNCHDLSP
jgi:hypothetical protein